MGSRMKGAGPHGNSEEEYVKKVSAEQIFVGRRYNVSKG